MFGKHFLLSILLLFISALNLALAEPECTPADPSISEGTLKLYTQTIAENCDLSTGEGADEFNQCKKNASFSYSTDKILKTCKPCSSGKKSGLQMLCENIHMNEDLGIYEPTKNGKKVFNCVLAEIKKEVEKKQQTVEQAVDASAKVIKDCCVSVHGIANC